MDKVNIDLTEELVMKNFAEPKTMEAMLNRNTQALEMFIPWVKGKILDIGCREGILLGMLQDTGYKELYGIDISEFAINFLKSNLLEEDTVQAQVADAHELPYEDEFFDTVFALHSVEHCKDTFKAIEEIYRVLKKGGHALIEIPLQKKEPVPTKWGHWHCFESEEEIINHFFRFKKVQMFKKDKKPWRRFVFKKED
jgi:ubiquinone/menaquinone biosynthesis C-methylase UbiE